MSWVSRVETLFGLLGRYLNHVSVDVAFPASKRARLRFSASCPSTREYPARPGW